MNLIKYLFIGLSSAYIIYCAGIVIFFALNSFKAMQADGSWSKNEKWLWFIGAPLLLVMTLVVAAIGIFEGCTFLYKELKKT